MRYWDASALVPLITTEPRSESARRWLAEDRHIVTWAWSRAEIVSAVERSAREGAMSRRQRRAVLDRLDTLAAGWDEVTEVLAVRARALALLARHPLRAADAGQLGSALVVQEQIAAPLAFVCLDRRLADAAELESLRVIPEEPDP